MRIEFDRYTIKLIPEDEQDVAYIEDTMGLCGDGDNIILERFDVEGEEFGFCLETDIRPMTVNKDTLPPHPSIKKGKEELYQRPIDDFIDFTDSFDGPPYNRTSPEGTKKLE